MAGLRGGYLNNIFSILIVDSGEINKTVVLSAALGRLSLDVFQVTKTTFGLCQGPQTTGSMGALGRDNGHMINV